MTNLAFTPAPWIIGQPAESNSLSLPVLCGNVRSSAFALPIAEAHGFNHADRLANARLIAAAPELLELARCFYCELTPLAADLDPGDPALRHYDYMLGKIRRVIDDATGELAPPTLAQVGATVDAEDELEACA